MTKQNDVLKCSICGNVVELAKAGLGEKICQDKASDDKEYFECILNAGQLNCCGKQMDLLVVKTDDTGHEKHKPVLEKSKNFITVTCGSIPHPMEETHHIEWIELVTSDDRVYRKNLKPGSPAQAKFDGVNDIILVRSLCNIHGLWETSIK
jgi:superoxide reductase